MKQISGLDCGADGRWFKPRWREEYLLFASGVQKAVAKIQRCEPDFQSRTFEKNEEPN